jgi:GT2 family glycosyltransferase
MELSVVVVTYRARDFIGACLSAAKVALAGMDAEVCVVDNASPDGTADFVRKEHPWVKLVEAGKNGGFPFGINLGIKNTTGRYVLWLNPDSRMLPDAGDGLRNVIAWMDGHPEVGIVGGRILNPDGSVQRSVRAFPSYGAVFGARYSLLTRWIPNNPMSTAYLRGDLTYDKPEIVDWVSGACLLHRRTVSDALGGADEGFFVYFEDVDFSYRASHLGWKTYFHPGFSIEHDIGGTSDQIPTRMMIVRHRSMWRWYTKAFKRFWLKDAVIWTGIWARCGLILATQFWARLWRRS